MLILLFSVIQRLHGQSLRAYAAKLRAAYRRGRSARTLVELRYERYWDAPVSDVQRVLSIPPLA